MKYLKIYEDFGTIPDNFIRLDSISYVLDPQEGVIYAMLKNGGYEHDAPWEVIYDDLVDVSDEDMEIINKYFLSCQPVIETKINWELIQTAKDVSLDYLDEKHGLFLAIQTFVKSDEKKPTVGFLPDNSGDFINYLVYSCIFSHSSNTKEYTRFFPKKMEIVKSKSEEIGYCFWFASSKGERDLEYIDSSNGEIFDRLSGMFPDEYIINYVFG
jgi:hypothetical protein